MTKLDRFLPFILVAIFLGLFGVLVLFELLHPCTRYEVQQCEECSLTIYLPDGDGNPTIPTCFEWEKVPCRVCVERAP